MALFAFPPNFPICIRRYLCWLERCVSRRPLLCNLRQYSCKVVKSLKDCIVRTVGATSSPDAISDFCAPLMSASSYPKHFLMRANTVLCWLNGIIRRPFFSSSGFKLARSLIPATILALLQIGQFSPLDLAFALACHSWPHCHATNIVF